jgi:hypothetical protein
LDENRWIKSKQLDALHLYAIQLHCHKLGVVACSLTQQLIHAEEIAKPLRMIY